MSLDSLLRSGALGPGEVAVRLGLAVLFGLIVGLDREMLDKPAGLRTHAMISLAACSFAVIALAIAESMADRGADPIRALQAVATGVAFIGGGAIIRGGGGVHGMTTGAGIWLAGAIGLACGAGLYFLALLATALGVVLLAVLRVIESRLLGGRADRRDKAASDARRR